MPSRKHIREIELSRRLADIFRMLPYENHLNFMSNLLSLMNSDNQFQGLEIGTEQTAKKKKSESGTNNVRNRYDIVLPLSTQNIKNIIFELKLDEPDEDQLKRYARDESDALVVSLAKTTKIAETTNNNSRSKKQKKIVQITWSDLFGALLQLLGFDARNRLVGKREQPTISEHWFVSQDKPRPISKDLELYIEDYLRDILKADLVPRGERAFVGTGEKATRTTSNYDVYTYRSNWDHNFKYVCIVFRNSLQYIGKVEKKYPDISIREKADKTLVIINNDTGKQIKDKKIINCVDQIRQDPFPTAIVKLKMIFCREPEKRDEKACKPWIEAIDHEKYKARGAFTMSHRYFDFPEDFVEAFTATPEEQDK